MATNPKRDEYLLQFAAIDPDADLATLNEYAAQAASGVSIHTLLAMFLKQRSDRRSSVWREALAPLGERPS